MKSCENWREGFEEALHGGVDSVAGLREHLEICEDCRDLYQEYSGLFGDSPWLGELPAPSGLQTAVSDSPCTRWLRRLFQAVDRELGEEELGDLFEHLEGCEDCRRVWVDLSLIHQLGEAMEAPEGLLQLCLRHEAPRVSRPVLGRKTASAAAYFLAVLASLIIGNPVTFARYNQASATVQQIRKVVSPEVSAVARSGRGEFRVMLWRCLRWGEERLNSIEATWDRLSGREGPSDSRKEKEGSS